MGQISVKTCARKGSDLSGNQQLGCIRDMAAFSVANGPMKLFWKSVRQTSESGKGSFAA